MKITKLYYNRILTLALCILLLLSCLCAVPNTAIVYAEDSEDKYTGVIEDLSQDPEFSITDYPRKNLGMGKTDYSLSVIQIAESSDNELFVYVYQPCDEPDRRASSIRISTMQGDDYSTDDYSLTYLNHGGHSTNEATLFKYKVEDLTVISDPVRYYNIVCIFRKWDKNIDDRDENGNTVNEIAYEVGQKWTAVTSEHKVSYYYSKSETITVTDKFVDFLRYPNGWKFSFVNDACDSHYIAFSTDIDIEYLYDADVEYRAQVVLGKTPTGDITEHKVSLSDIDEASNAADGWFAEKHTWNRIERVEDFKTEITDASTIAALRGKKWVLRFTETKCTYGKAQLSDTVLSSVAVTEVTILRLHFKSNGVTYNLGVVDNKQSGDDIPGNNGNYGSLIGRIIDWVKDNWRLLLIGFIAVIAIVVLAPFLPSILSLLLHVFVWLGKGLLWLITSPVRLIKALIARGDK